MCGYGGWQAYPPMARIVCVNDLQEEIFFMGQKVSVTLTCDMHDDEVDAVDTVAFGVDGHNYAFELCQEHLDEFSDTMQAFVAAARRADGPRRRRRSSAEANGSGPRSSRARQSGAEDLGAIREWARSNGFRVSSRGRIASEVREAFDKAQA